MAENKLVSLGIFHPTFILGAPFHPIDSLFFGGPSSRLVPLIGKKKTIPKGQGTVPNWPASLPESQLRSEVLQVFPTVQLLGADL